MKTTEFIVGREEQILEKYGFHITGNRHIDCPVCGSKKSFRIHDSTSYGVSWICKCGSGNLIDLLMQTGSKSFKDICDEIDRDFGNTSDYEKKPVNNDFETKYKALLDITGSQVEGYLFSRGITNLPPHSIRHSKSEWHKESGKKYEAMYAVASDERMRPAIAHVTYLENGRKAGDPCRKMFIINKAQNVAVKLFNVGAYLGVAEGIETALSAAQKDNVPVWATLNTSIMKKFRAPLGVKTLCIYADNDSHGAGLAAAFECGHKNILCKNEVSKVLIRWPKCGDWNDWINDQGPHYEWVLI